MQREAAPLYALSQNADDPAELWERALLFDASLKQRRLNPGASADLTVATLFADDCATSVCPTSRQTSCSLSGTMIDLRRESYPANRSAGELEFPFRTLQQG